MHVHFFISHQQSQKITTSFQVRGKGRQSIEKDVRITEKTIKKRLKYFSVFLNSFFYQVFYKF